MAITRFIKNGIEHLVLDSNHLQLTIVPALGGKILSIFNRPLGREFLWTNKDLSVKVHLPGADYDSNFIGGIDELIPNDIPETIDSVTYPDHGELWTTALEYEIKDDQITVQGNLPLSGLHYKKSIRLDPRSPIVHLEYQIRNESETRRNFLWKLHAALNIEAGDSLISDAVHGKVVDPAYSRFTNSSEFKWPVLEKTNASLIPVKNNSMDFFYLYDIKSPQMHLLTNDQQCLFGYLYDKKIFPYQWYFASYGGFLDHYTAILEPCTSMPISVNEAKELKQCTVLEPGQELNTKVRIFAGEKKNYISSHE
jgi:hypothetical protein